MFNLQGSEIVIVMLLALVVLGPEKLPDAMRRAGQLFAELKKMSAGFQDEFRAAVDEPMRELRDTANTLRDSADFTKLQSGDRTEKPKSAEMAPTDPTDAPSDAIPTFDGDDVKDAATTPDASAEPRPAAGSRPAPFSGQSSAAPRRPPEQTVSAPIVAPPPFGSMSAPVSDAADANGDPATAASDAAVPADDEHTAGTSSATADVDEQPPA